MDFKKAREAGLIQKFNPLPAYFDQVDIDQHRRDRGEPTALRGRCHVWGAGAGVIKSFLQGTGCEIAEIRGE